jgi:hypothetical protein
MQQSYNNAVVKQGQSPIRSPSGDHTRSETIVFSYLNKGQNPANCVDVHDLKLDPTMEANAKLANGRRERQMRIIHIRSTISPVKPCVAMRERIRNGGKLPWISATMTHGVGTLMRELKEEMESKNGVSAVKCLCVELFHIHLGSIHHMIK